MAQTGLNIFDRTLQETNTWLGEISEAMNFPDRQMAYHALRGVLFTLRDRLPPEEAVKLSQQLPVLVRGIYFEGYKMSKTPIKYNREEFIEQVGSELNQAGGANPENAARAVLQVLSRHISQGEAEQVRNALPKHIQTLWPEEMAAS